MIEARVEHLPDVRRFVRQRAAVLGASQEAIADLVQAIDECVANVIVHGYRGAEGFVDVDVSAESRGLVARVHDRAPPFDPTTVPEPDPNRSFAERARGGMGVSLMRAFVDELRYDRLPDGRNEVTMIKRIRRD